MSREAREDWGTEPYPPPTPVKSHSYTPKIQTIFTLIPRPSNGASLAGRSRPAFVVFGSSLPSSTKTTWNIKKKTMSESKLSGSASAKREREREKEREREGGREGGMEGERERAYGARKTFSHNFDFYFVQTAERVCVIVMWREIKLSSQLIRNWANKWQWLHGYYGTNNRIKGPFFSWMCFNNCWKTCWNRKFDKNAFQTKAIFGNMQWTDTDTCENILS